jgi:hypothetical protein
LPCSLGVTAGATDASAMAVVSAPVRPA